MAEKRTAGSKAATTKAKAAKPVKATTAKATTAKAASAKTATAKAATVKVAAEKTATVKVTAEKEVKSAKSATASAAKVTAKKAVTKKAAPEKAVTEKAVTEKEAKPAKTAAASTAKAAMANKAKETKPVKAATEKAAKATETAKEKASAAQATKTAKTTAAKTTKLAKPTAAKAAKADSKSKAEPKSEPKTKKESELESASRQMAASEKKADSGQKSDLASPLASASQAQPEIELESSAETVRQPEFSDLPGVLIAAVECTPFVKIGGLADMVGALPKYLKKLGVDARVIMPFHRQIKDRYAGRTEHLCDFEARLGWRSQYVGLEKLELDGMTYYFIDNEFYFGGPVYCGGEFEGEQYAFFTRAVLDAIPQLDFTPGILHSNDWHTAMMPLLVKTQYNGGMQAGLRTLLTIHNLHFQGQFSHEFDRDLLGVDDSLATPQFVEHYGCDNMLKAGIVFADKVNTVSPTYAREICDAYLGESLDGVLRSRGSDLVGILNAIDTDVWNPETDEYLPAHYSEKNLEGKSEVKAALLEELGLVPAPKGEEVPVISMVGRLTPQKGLDMVRCVLDDIMAENVRMIILGTGDSEFEDYLRDAENRYKGRLCSYIGYAGELAHRIYAGSDLFLMPSKFEPCGISQMIAMRYGTLPVVRETGGLKDTVTPYNEFTGEGNGFSFANYNAHEMLGVIRYALSVWWNRDARHRLMKQAMSTDNGFDRCARSYAELYRSLLR